MGTLTVHSVVEVDMLDELTAVAEGDLVNEDGYNSVDEVVDTCIDGTRS